MEASGAQKELEVTPDERRDDVEVLGLDWMEFRVEVDSLGITLLSPLEVVDVESLVGRREADEKRVDGSGLSKSGDIARSTCAGRIVDVETSPESVLAGELFELPLEDAPTSQDSPLPNTDGEAALIELSARRFPMSVAGDSLRPQAVIRAMERTDLIARTAMDPVCGGDPSSLRGRLGGMDRAAEGAGDAERLRVEAEEMEEDGPCSRRILLGWDPGRGAENSSQ